MSSSGAPHWSASLPADPRDEVLAHIHRRGPPPGLSGATTRRSSFLPVVSLMQAHGRVAADAATPATLPHGFSVAHAHNDALRVYKSHAAGTAVLHWLAQHGKGDYVGLALARGARVDRPDVNGRTPLMMACAVGCVGAVRVLVKFGARVELVDAKGYTALLLAALKGSGECVRLVLERAGEVLGVGAREAFLNSRLPSGVAALGVAARMGSLEILEILFEYGAHESVSFDGESCYELACKYGHRDVAEWLLRRSASVGGVSARHGTLMHREVVPGGVDEYGEVQPPVQP